SWLYRYDEVRESEKTLNEFNADYANPLRRADARKAFDLWRAAVQPEHVAEGWEKEREAFTLFMRRISTMPSDVRTEEIDVDGVRSVRVVPPGGESGPAIVHFEGNGY